MITDEKISKALAAFNKALNEPVMLKCERCEGRGYHHGFGETGHDPDWCEVCGGNQYNIAPGEEERAMRIALEAALTPSAGEAEPVAWMRRQANGIPVLTSIPRVVDIWRDQGCAVEPLYTHPYLSASEANGQDGMGNALDVEDIREQKLATIVAPDNGTPDEVLLAIYECATAWVPEARIIGNVRAGDIARAVRAALSTPEQGETEADGQQMTVADFATRLFDLHGFMLLETYRGKHAVTVTFPDLQEAQQFYNALVELSRHRTRPSALEGNDDA